MRKTIHQAQYTNADLDNSVFIKCISASKFQIDFIFSKVFVHNIFPYFTMYSIYFHAYPIAVHIIIVSLHRYTASVK